MELPPLTVAALIPVVAASSATANDNPFRHNDPNHSNESLQGKHDDETGRDQPIERAKAIPRLIEQMELRGVKLP